MSIRPMGLLALLAHWREIRLGRARLARLPDGALKDLGLSRSDVWAEINKPFWRN